MKLKNDFLDALLKEIELRKDYIGDAAVETIYFGGGTPSLLLPDEIQRIIGALRDQFNVSSNAEITFEANPDDISTDKLLSWETSGINRLSIGIQSFFEDDLQWMNRAHNAAQALRCITDAQSAGFTNMSIDLIYGGPTLSDERWKKNLQNAMDLHIPHLSCYALTVEPRTALDSLINKKKLAPVSSDDQARQFTIMTEFLSDAGYEHYEISNFALPGMRSRHNSSYWNGERYIGLGPSAHSFNGFSRQWNVANNALYIQGLKRNQVPFEQEVLTPQQMFNEYVMTSLRTMEGMNLEFVHQRFGDSFSEELMRTSGKFIEQGLVIRKDDRLVLSKEGKLFADGIAADLFA